MALLHLVDRATLAPSRTTREPDIQSAVDKVRSTFDVEHCGYEVRETEDQDNEHARVARAACSARGRVCVALVRRSIRTETAESCSFSEERAVARGGQRWSANSDPLDNWFGADVAIRDGFAFAGMPKTNARGQVAVFTQQGTQESL
jgi:hypothetical protein